MSEKRLKLNCLLLQLFNQFEIISNIQNMLTLYVSGRLLPIKAFVSIKPHFPYIISPFLVNDKVLGPNYAHL